ncbi:hypothetical protein MVEN_00737100 [Mycena venus]|uniref:DRBM domain-containing protein n=1 Tax=Mycena venus TaxID=2733690 RepID=A0A8H6YF96_9AGAR|nr:hypothetical protein MVEN_00737100 [Mycena venus]
MFPQASESQTGQIWQTISGGAGGLGGQGSDGGQGGRGGTGQGPRMNYDINTQHFSMPVHFVLQDYQSQSSDATQPVEERRRLRDANGVKIIRLKNLALIREIGSGPEYLFHAGENKGNAVIIKVFNSTGPAVRQRLDAAVALSKGMHPNLLRLLGISSPESCFHFMVYENVHWKNAEGPLSVALKKDLTRSIMLGFKMIAGLSAGINYISLQGVYLGSMKVENFDIFLDVNDRFVMCIHPPSLEDGNTAKHQEPHENAWVLLNGLCEKILVSANHLTHQDQINREPAIVDVVRPGSRPSLLSFGPTSQTIREEEPGVHPRREYIWLTLVRGEQSLATVAHRITLALDTEISSLHRLSQSDGQSAHRCTGYKREEITLATTMLHSAVVAYDAPSPSEICSVCHEVVGHHETFRCVCGASVPGTRHTIKCQVCKFWSHSDCVGNSTEFTCSLCLHLAIVQGEDPVSVGLEATPGGATAVPPPEPGSTGQDWDYLLKDNSDTSSTHSPFEPGPPLLFDSAQLPTPLVFHSKADHPSHPAVSPQSDMIPLCRHGFNTQRSHGAFSLSQESGMSTPDTPSSLFPSNTFLAACLTPPSEQAPRTFSGQSSYYYRMMLNNFAQQYGWVTTYESSWTGPQSQPRWTAVTYVNNIEYGRGIGRKRSSAKESAAKGALIAVGVVRA